MSVVTQRLKRPLVSESNIYAHHNLAKNKLIEMNHFTTLQMHLAGTDNNNNNTVISLNLKGRVERIFALHHLNCLYLMNTKWYLL